MSSPARHMRVHVLLSTNCPGTKLHGHQKDQACFPACHSCAAGLDSTFFHDQRLLMQVVVGAGALLAGAYIVKQYVVPLTSQAYERWAGKPLLGQSAAEKAAEARTAELIANAIQVNKPAAHPRVCEHTKVPSQRMPKHNGIYKQLSCNGNCRSCLLQLALWAPPCATLAPAGDLTSVLAIESQSGFQEGHAGAACCYLQVVSVGQPDGVMTTSMHHLLLETL